MIITTPEFWVFVAFVLLVVSCGRRVFSYVSHILDAHSQKVAQQLAETERLHDEAFNLLNTYKKKHAEALQQVEEIHSFSEQESAEFKRAKMREFEQFVEQKEKTLEARLAIEKEEAVSKLRQEVVKEALMIVKHILSKDKKERKKLTEAALKEIEEVVVKEKSL